ncbi:MAG: DNA translocase FtsK [Candidatus Cardinium sp.]|uniref:FtsK/SpoIIIE family DNA translocase n=1 Tax=Cardinium endosymbiont of Dermatophagoides farinae TaxID=2597823 RepID=UPI0011822455|nr:DNA translocase FtsK [Cardinium endosymbiont of Dermatophagoides farinae]TSJ80568.1 DNA translocase FtsK [Cardinium endosymbiont of Dermatophagoides farinae]UWW96548.1 MAG: DNA translocase FtsK [Candidatus Cardinium sp.]
MAQNNYKIQPDAPKKKAASNRSIVDQRIKITIGFFLQGISIFLACAFFSHPMHGAKDQHIIESIQTLGIKASSLAICNWLGLTGAFVSYYCMHVWWGITAFIFLPFLFLMGIKMVTQKIWPNLSLLKVMMASIFLVLWFNILLGYLYTLYPTATLLADHLGGVAYELGTLFKGLLGYGTFIFLFITLIIFSVLCFNITSLPRPFKKARKEDGWLLDQEDNRSNDPSENGSLPSKKKTNNIESPTTDSDDRSDESDLASSAKSNVDFEVVAPQPAAKSLLKPSPSAAPTTLPLKQLTSENYDPTLDLSNYKYPSLDLLERYEQAQLSVTQEELAINKNNIVQTLQNFKINIAKIKATIGPTVTLYEIVPEAGVKISKIKNLEDDIALNLAALGIRIIAPIPGKGTIGIEVPNKNREIVPLQEMLASEKFLKGKMDLPIVLGKSISNELFIADLGRMPHLLIAGATGQGKSVGLNVLLTSLIYKKHPSQLKLVLVDPKKVELSLYNRLERHFLAKLPISEEPIITETKKVIHTLNSLCIEMDHRYELLKEAGTRNIKEYNEKFIKRILNPQEGHRFLPYIVLVIDEFADMMMTAGKEIEVPIARLTQLARAIGIHLVLATQRPSVNVITGIIKANFPVRVSYKVSSRIDSRTILDASGAEQLVGNGDMLLSMNSDIIRLQAPFLDTAEVERVCSYIGGQPGYPSAYLLPTYDEEDKEDSLDLQETDPLFEEAARLIVLHQQGSTSLIQRKLKLGYNRSGRLIDQLEAAGIVGPFEGSKAREVLVTDEASLNDILARLPQKA